jgi:sialate O-acetylesterase
VGDFPFLIVSLANLNKLQTQPTEPGWAEIRESQWRTVRTIPNTGLAMTIDIGDPDNIHPRNKQEVGRRLSLVARNLVYGEKDLVYSGPEFVKMQIEQPGGNKVRLYFKNIGGGLVIKPGDKNLSGFVIAGADKKFVWADAVIDGETIVVSSPEIPEPKFVRYGWAWNPMVNLFNKEGLPAITFRTDE